MKRILLSGATGYLGSYISKELQKRDYLARVVAPSIEKLRQKSIKANEVHKAERTQPRSI